MKLMDDVVGEEVEKACADPEAWALERWLERLGIGVVETKFIQIL